MTRRAPAQTKPTMTGPSRAVPECPLGCGYSGWPTAQESPYLACSGDPARHQRNPVGAA